jgi:hypothetical protein
MLIKIASGQKSSAPKNPPLSEPPKRIKYLQEEGVFLNEFQERITLEKMLWKEQYREDAVTMYWIARELEDRNKDLLAINTSLKADLRFQEDENLKIISQTEFIRKENETLKKDNRAYKLDNYKLGVQVKVFKFTTIIVSATLVYVVVTEIIL